MRVKRKKHGSERLRSCEYTVIGEPEHMKNGLGELFGNDNPVCIEIGCGKGGFISALALANPQVNYLAFERISDVLVSAAEKIRDLGITNVKVCCINANTLGEYLPAGSVEKIYLNFSDPWPKKKHTKRRLTYRSFLEIYKGLLAENGEIIMKTDNRPLFDFSLEELRENGFEIKECTFDLHADNPEDNIMTEYERRFSEQGSKICRLKAVLLSAEPRSHAQ